jgi:hypothetical protein
MDLEICAVCDAKFSEKDGKGFIVNDGCDECWVCSNWCKEKLEVDLKAEKIPYTICSCS